MIHPISARPINSFLHRLCLAAVAATVIAGAYDTASAQSNAVQAIVGETNAKTPEVSTVDVRRILSDASAILVDSRKRGEFVAGHIAGAKNASSVDEIGKLVDGDKGKALVLYCNGQNCQASRTLSEQLVTAGFTNIKRYQLGIPMWRALNGPVEIELEGVLRIYKVDQTAKFFDARAAAEFAKVNLPDEEFHLYQKLFDIIYQQLVQPDLLIYLHAPVQQLQKNIHKRNRPYEQSIPDDYLFKLQETYTSYIKQHGIKTLFIDATNADFLGNEKHFQVILDALEKNYEPGHHYFTLP